MINFTLIQIDAWRDPECGWYWNNHYKLEDGIQMDESELTPRKVLRFLRTEWLSEYSKGRVSLDWHDEICEGYLIEICDRNTGEPLFALSTIH